MRLCSIHAKWPLLLKRSCKPHALARKDLQLKLSLQLQQPYCKSSLLKSESCTLSAKCQVLQKSSSLFVHAVVNVCLPKGILPTSSQAIVRVKLQHQQNTCMDIVVYHLSCVCKACSLCIGISVVVDCLVLAEDLSPARHLIVLADVVNTSVDAGQLHNLSSLMSCWRSSLQYKPLPDGQQGVRRTPRLALIQTPGMWICKQLERCHSPCIFLDYCCC